jgi:hypothetical protein
MLLRVNFLNMRPVYKIKWLLIMQLPRQEVWKVMHSEFMKGHFRNSVMCIRGGFMNIFHCLPPHVCMEVLQVIHQNLLNSPQAESMAGC